MYADEEFTLIGIHTPEFSHERDPANVRQAVADQQIPYPVALDNDRRLWTAFRNRFWPSLYVIDRRGIIRDQHVGELHMERADWEELTMLIKELLKEPSL